MNHKVLSMLQPWASALVWGDKRVETRSFNTKHRGPLLIHASLGLSRQQQLSLLDIQSRHPLSFIRPTDDPRQNFVDMPRGAIIGMVNVVETFQFGTPRAIEYLRSLDESARMKEIAIGDWGEGRWGWLVTDPILFIDPIPAKGALSIWNWEGDIPELQPA